MSTVTTLSLLYQVRLAVNDLDTSGGVTSDGAWMTNNAYKGFIARGVVSTETTYKFYLKAAGLWLADGLYGGNPYAFRFASDSAPFANPSTTSNVYVVNSFGSIETTGTDTTASYDVTAAIVDYAGVMSDLFFWLAQHRFMQIAAAGGAYPGETAKQLMEASGYWAGIRSSQ